MIGIPSGEVLPEIEPISVRAVVKCMANPNPVALVADPWISTFSTMPVKGLTLPVRLSKPTMSMARLVRSD
jgi:hypothetical protein